MKTLFKSVEKYFYDIVDIFFTKRCLGCHILGDIVCDNCLSGIKQNEDIKERYIFALYRYQEVLIKKIIWQLKYYKRRDLGTLFGKILYQNYIEEIHEMRIYNLGQNVLVLPVPLSRKRLKMRGYNQAELLAYSFCSQTQKDILELRTDILEKIKDSIPQAHIKNRKNRLENAKNAYKINNPTIIKNRNIIIIDDVYTTGGTINEIKRILEKSGARKVIGITIAH